MTKTTKTNRVQKFQKEAWKKFFSETKQTSSVDDFRKQIGMPFTPLEIIMFEKRLIIFLLLEKGVGSREISRLIDVSPTTVNFVKHHFIKKPVVHRQYSSEKRAPKFHHSSKGVGALLWKQ